VKSSKLAFIAFVALSIVVLLGIGEMTTRVALRLLNGSWPQTELMASYQESQIISALAKIHPYLNAAPQNSKIIKAVGKRATFNSLGYRSPERPLEKPADSFRIVCEGGSTTFDTQADSDEETWPWRLEEILSSPQAEMTRPVEVWNAGFPTWTSLENVISLLIRDVDLKPDLVILYQAYNDLQPGAHHPFDREYVNGHAEYSRLALGLSQQKPSWIDRSVMVERLKSRLRPQNHQARTTTTHIAKLGAATFRRNVRSLIAIAHANGAQVLLVTQPIRIRKAHVEADRRFIEEWLHLDADSAPEALRNYNDVLRSLARSEHVMLLDVQQDIVFSDEDFWDAVHFASTGSKKLAEAIAEKITQLENDEIIGGRE